MAGRTLGRGRVIPAAPFVQALSPGDEEPQGGTTMHRNPFTRIARGTPAEQTPEPSHIAQPSAEPLSKQSRAPSSGMIPSPPSVMDNLPSSGVLGPSVTGPLADRFSAVQEGIASGEMDSQGMNYTTFGPHVGMGNTPVARFLDAVHNSVTPTAPGNIDVANRPVVNNTDGTISTERSIDVSLGQNGKAILGGPEDSPRVLIPTIVKGHMVSDQEAVDHYNRSGEHLGIFKNSKEAGDYATQLHNQQDQRYSPSPSQFDFSSATGQFMQGLVDNGPKLNREVLDTVPLSENVEDRRFDAEEHNGGREMLQPAPDEEDLRKLNEHIRI